MALVDIITPEVVKVPLEARDKPEVIRELVQILKDAGKIKDLDSVVEAIHQREQKGSTGLESGIAVPHAKTAAVKTLTVSIGISRRGIDFDSMDGKPSQLFFLILASPDQSGPHIEALAEIARLTRTRAFCKAMLNAGSPQEVVSLFRED
ncbi:MAG: PTS sugar transporter subunit IIA [Spirochaetota bacterium]